MRKATNVARENLFSLGTCFGKITKSGKFRLHITALDFLAPYAKVSLNNQEVFVQQGKVKHYLILIFYVLFVSY